jgi:hypothetical protein
MVGVSLLSWDKSSIEVKLAFLLLERNDYLSFTAYAPLDQESMTTTQLYHYCAVISWGSVQFLFAAINRAAADLLC